MHKLKESTVRKIFDVLVVIKGVDGIFESFAGLVVLFVNRGAILSFSAFLTAHELAEDPHDFIANGIVQFASSFSADAKTFIAAYLLVHGAVKIFLVVNLLRGKLWAYPIAMGFLGIFLVYQIDRLLYGFSIWFFVLSIFDAILLFLVWHEYRWKKGHLSIRG